MRVEYTSRLEHRARARMSDSPPDPLQTASAIASVAAALKKRRQRKHKFGLAADVKLRPLRPTRITDVVHRDVSDVSDRRAAIQQHLEQLDKLPANSAFARHRRQMLRMTLSLMDRYPAPPGTGPLLPTYRHRSGMANKLRTLVTR